MKVFRKITNMIKQAYISTVGNDKGKYPVTEITYNGKVTSAVRFSPYGLCSNPPLKSNCIVFTVNSQESLKYALTDDMENRFNYLKEGEVAIFNYITKSFMHLKENGDIYIFSANDKEEYISANHKVTIKGNATIDIDGSLTATTTGNTNITAPTVAITGNVTVSGTIVSQGNVTGAGVSLNSHTHGGVTTGSGNTGAPN